MAYSVTRPGAVWHHGSSIVRGQYVAPRPRLSVVVFTVLLVVLTAAWQASLASAAGEPPPATYRAYFPLLDSLAGDGSQVITLTQTFAAQAWQAESAGPDYAAVVAGRAWLVTYDQSMVVVGQSATAGDQVYRANKAFLFFDTTPLPANATVLAATLTAPACRRVDGPAFTLQLYRATAPLPPQPADWRSYGGPIVGALDAAQCGTADVPRDAPVALEPTSLAQGRLTAFALTTDRLEAGLVPAWGSGDKLVFDAYAPNLLVVRFTMPPE